MKQVTFAPRHHQLTNINARTPDSQWLVFDVRPSGASFTGETIERVNVNSGTVETIYRATQGAHVGVVTVHPTQSAMCLFMAPSGRMRSGSMIFIIAAGWWPFRGLSRIWTPWTLPLHARRAARRQPRPCL